MHVHMDTTNRSAWRLAQRVALAATAALLGFVVGYFTTNYWFTAASVAQAFGWSGDVGMFLRVATLLLVATWTWNALAGRPEWA